MIGSRPIYWYGVLTAIGFGAAFFHWSRQAKLHGRNPELASDLVLWLMVGGVIGGRIAYIAANWHEYAGNWVSAVRIDRGGLVFYGGAIGGAIAVAILARRRGMPLMTLADFVITGVPLGHAFGRIGCYLNGCCHGHESHTCLAEITGGKQPTQLYEAVGLMLIYYGLAKRYGKEKHAGRILALYLMAYPALRFVVEFFRGDARLRILQLSIAQWTSLMLFIVGAARWRWAGSRRSGG